MSDRPTKQRIYARCANLNRRLRSTGRHVEASFRNGGCALDEYEGTACIRLLLFGTSRQVFDYLDAMIVGIDLAAVRPTTTDD